jgi:hypothetical protein
MSPFFRLVPSALALPRHPDHAPGQAGLAPGAFSSPCRLGPAGSWPANLVEPAPGPGHRLGGRAECGRTCPVAFTGAARRLPVGAQRGDQAPRPAQFGSH